MKEEDLPGQARLRGEQLTGRLKHLQLEFPEIGDVRGLGLMVGVEFRSSDGKPDKASAKAVLHACQERGLLLLICGAWDNTIRWIPPLVVTEAQIDEAVDIFAAALDKAVVKV
jgi:4-aminobutyrate aminotransferase